MADPCQAAQVVANPALNMVNMFEHTVHVVLADLGARGQMMACRRFANAGSHPAKAPTRAATSAIFCVWEMIRHWQTLTKRCCKTMLVRPTFHGHFRVRQCQHPAACRGSVHHRAAFTIVQRSPSLRHDMQHRRIRRDARPGNNKRHRIASVLGNASLR